MTATTALALILGSTREGRFCETVARWAAARLALRADVTIDVIDPLDFDLPRRLAREPGPAVGALRARLAVASGFIVVTP